MVYVCTSVALSLRWIGVRDRDDAEERQKCLESVHDRLLFSVDLVNTVAKLRNNENFAQLFSFHG